MAENLTSNKLLNPWREFIENVMEGKNYFRTSEYMDLLADLDRLYALGDRAAPEPPTDNDLRRLIEIYEEKNPTPLYADGVLRCLRELQRRRTDEPPAARSKFDLAHEIMRQLEAEEMDTMQSCHFGYVLRVVREGSAQPPSGWQPIETAPKDGAWVLVSNAERGGAWIARYDDVYQSGYKPENPWFSMMLNMRWHGTKWASTVPTHWQPMPSRVGPETESATDQNFSTSPAPYAQCVSENARND